MQQPFGGNAPPGGPVGGILPGGTPDNPLAMGGAPNPPVINLPLNRIRQVSIQNLERMRQSSVPVSVFAEADATNLMAVREKLKPLAQQRLGLDLTYLPFFARAAVKALQQYPLMNGVLTPMGHAIPRTINLGIATSVPGAVLIPTIHGAERMNFWELARAADLLIKRAKAGLLNDNDMTMQTCVITNTGSLGESIFGTPVLLPSNTTSLAFETIRKRPVVTENDQITVRPMMYLAMTADHRAVDGAEMIGMLGRLKQILERVEM